MASKFNGTITNPNFPNLEMAFAECEVVDWWGDFTGICARLVAYRSPFGGLRFRWEASSTNARRMPACFESILQAVESARAQPNMRNVQEFANV
jgi:hypothetical protein